MDVRHLRNQLRIKCEDCCALCCTALFCMKSDGFPQDKQSGVPCIHLKQNHQCNIHENLCERRLMGCMRYDCCGAGQMVTQNIYKGRSWHNDDVDNNQMFMVFNKIHQIHQIVWYLLEAYDITKSDIVRTEVENLICKYERMQSYTPEEILNENIDQFQKKANMYLKKVMNEILKRNKKQCMKKKDFIANDMRHMNLQGMDLTMSLLIKADLRNTILYDVNFLGADMRDADIRGADLHKSCFLTQMQVNCCKGDKHTHLPDYLEKPSYWL